MSLVICWKMAPVQAKLSQFWNMKWSGFKYMITYEITYFIENLFVTEFRKITQLVAPETIRIFEFSMARLIAETTFKNISKLCL